MDTTLLNDIKHSNSRFIVITGGVCSSIGKGVLISSIGVLLKNAGFSVSVVKWDPYLNVDPGTMSPMEHGEVFVTADGAETDLDLGHYERLIGVQLERDSSVSAGQIFHELLEQERSGTYLGKTIQLIPHVADACKMRLLTFAKKHKVDFVLLEIGGTVGDMEGDIFLEAIRQLTMELGKERILLGHLSLVPTLPWTQEIKTKPTQHSVIALKKSGLMPDFLFIRSDKAIEKSSLKKLALMCGVAPDHIFEVITHSPLYGLFIDLQHQKLAQALLQAFNLPVRTPNITAWKKLVHAIAHAQKNITIAVVAKYVGTGDPYMSVLNAIKSAGHHHSVNVTTIIIDAEKLEHNNTQEIAKLHAANGILVPGGFDKRGAEGKISAIAYAREHAIPYLGLCLGMQLMLIEFARNVLRMSEANSTELDKNSPYPVISMLSEQEGLDVKGGTMRLGAQVITLKPGTLAYKAYGEPTIYERHRHRYEFNNLYRQAFEQAGITFSGIFAPKNLVEVAELTSHPFMVATQYHPEFTSSPLHSHPLFDAFIQAIVSQR